MPAFFITFCFSDDVRKSFLSVANTNGDVIRFNNISFKIYTCKLLLLNGFISSLTRVILMDNLRVGIICKYNIMRVLSIFSSSIAPLLIHWFAMSGWYYNNIV